MKDGRVVVSYDYDIDHEPSFGRPAGVRLVRTAEALSVNARARVLKIMYGRQTAVYTAFP
jgi:hypothetical protein